MNFLVSEELHPPFLNSEQMIAAIAVAPTARLHALADANNERVRQNALFAAGNISPSVCDPRTSNGARLGVLVEEVGEVAKAINEGTLTVIERKHLRAEVIQVAAVAIAWAEALDAGNRLKAELQAEERL